jgi:hypothetical protein
MMPTYVNETVADSAAGVVLMGSFITRAFKTGKTSEGRPQVEFPVPTLTIGGELDGLCRISRITEALYTQITFDENPDIAASTLPVTVIPGMNHMQFASGEIPPFVKGSDLQHEISEDEAQAIAVADAAAFMGSIVFPGESSYSTALLARVEESTAFVQPLTDAFLMESYQQYLPPCYCETEVSMDCMHACMDDSSLHRCRYIQCE